jgi:hypothetical protein
MFAKENELYANELQELAHSDTVVPDNMCPIRDNALKVATNDNFVSARRKIFMIVIVHCGE